MALESCIEKRGETGSHSHNRPSQHRKKPDHNIRPKLSDME